MSGRKRGFTVVELLVVIVVVGILGMIAMTKLRGARSQAVVAQMKSDLRNLVGAEVVHFAENGAYVNPPPLFISSADVTGPTISIVGKNFTAWVGNRQNGRTCAIFVGTTALAPASVEGEPACTP